VRGATAQEELVTIIKGSTHVLIDFDGPICRIFSGLSAEDAASRLLKILIIDGINFPPELQQATDPLEVLRFAEDADGHVADHMHSVLSETELEAVESAKPTFGSRELILACRRTERSVGIVSNNSQPAVEKYMRAHDLAQHVDVVSARTGPYLLKPDPHLILRAMDAFGHKRERFVLVGDSETDIEAAQAAGIHHIGYANKPGKLDRLTRAGANAVVTSLSELSNAVLASAGIRLRET
jgi:HAD superfamily hydrolase (TIGR01549 family)